MSLDTAKRIVFSTVFYTWDHSLRNGMQNKKEWALPQRIELLDENFHH